MNPLSKSLIYRQVNKSIQIMPIVSPSTGMTLNKIKALRGRKSYIVKNNTSLDSNNTKYDGIVAAGLAIVAEDTGRFLMLQRYLSDEDDAAGTWEFPGGHVEEGEDPLVSAKREWKEETGLTLPKMTEVGSYIGSNNIYVAFICKIKSENLINLKKRKFNTNPDGDIFESIAWVHPEDFSKHNLREELKLDLSKLWKFINKLDLFSSNPSDSDNFTVIVKSTSPGTCKPGQRSDLTGCTPIGDSLQGAGSQSSNNEISGNETKVTKVKQSVINGFKKATEKFTSVKETAVRFRDAGYAKLPRPLQVTISKVWGAAKFVEHKVMIGFHKTREVAVEAAKQRGMSEEQSQKLGKVLGTIDLISAWSVNAPLTLAVTGSFTAAKVSSWIPVASLAYIGYSTARNPLATVRAAKEVVRNSFSKKKEETKFQRLSNSNQVSKQSGNEINDNQLNYESLINQLSDNLMSDNSDWYLAILSQCLEFAASNKGYSDIHNEQSISDAVATANTIYSDIPESNIDGELSQEDLSSINSR